MALFLLNLALACLNAYFALTGTNGWRHISMLTALFCSFAAGLSTP